LVYPSVGYGQVNISHFLLKNYIATDSMFDGLHCFIAVLRFVFE